MEVDVGKDGSLDLVWGIKAIAAIIGRTERQTYHMCLMGELPVRKVGNRYVIERQRLVSVFTGSAA